jgi:hypothetical protein
MSLDEMAIKKGVRWDPGTKTFIGFPTIPWSEQDRKKFDGRLASKAMVLMLKGLDGKWEAEIGYFFTSSKMTGAVLARMVQGALKFIHNTPINICGLVCDGPATNIAMLNKLGK